MKDIWEINNKGLGNIKVIYDSEAEIYDGKLSDIEVTVIDQSGNAVMLPDFAEDVG